MNEIDFLRGIEGEKQQGEDLVSGAEQLVRLKIQSGQETRPQYEDLELKKEAAIFGADPPDVDEVAIPEKTRQKQYKEYVHTKAKEEPTGYLRSGLTGALVGGGVGAAIGALTHRGPGPISHSMLGTGLGGAPVGGLFGLLGAAKDKKNINTARDVVSSGDYEKGFADQVSGTVRDHRRDQWWNDERRHQQLLHKKASIKDVLKTVTEGAKGGLKYQGFGAGAGVTTMKADKARGVGHLLGMAAPAAAVGAAGYAAGHHAGVEKDADLSESIGSAAMCKGCGKVKEACGCPSKTASGYDAAMAAAGGLGGYMAGRSEDKKKGTHYMAPLVGAGGALGGALSGRFLKKANDLDTLKAAIREKLASAPPDWNKSMLAAATGLGALAGGIGTYLSSRPQKDTGKSKMEEDLGASVEANKGKPERGFLQKLKNREVESAHGISRVFREHPVKASLLGTVTGAAGGYGLGQLGGAIARLRGGK